MYLIWILGSKSKLTVSIKKPIKRNSVGSGHVSHRWTSAFDDHFDHGFVVFKDLQLRLVLRRICGCGDVVHMRQLINISVSLLFGVWICAFVSSFLLPDGLVIRYSSMNVILLSPHPTEREQEFHPFANQHPKK